MDYARANNFRRLADFLANFFPLVRFVFSDSGEESHTLLECQRLVLHANYEKYTSSSANSA